MQPQPPHQIFFLFLAMKKERTLDKKEKQRRQKQSLNSTQNSWTRYRSNSTSFTTVSLSDCNLFIIFANLISHCEKSLILKQSSLELINFDINKNIKLTDSVSSTEWLVILSDSERFITGLERDSSGYALWMTILVCMRFIAYGSEWLTIRQCWWTFLRGSVWSDFFSWAI